MRIIVSCVFICSFLLPAGCGAMQQSDRAIEDLLRSKKVVDLDQLTGSELRLLVKLVRKEASPCEGSLSLIEEMQKKKPCTPAVRALGFFFRRILDGYPESDILSQYVARFRISSKVSVLMEGRSDTGPADADVTIVSFSDFQCPFCRKAAAVIRGIKEEHLEKVRLVFKQWPMESIHPMAQDAAIAAEAALMQGRFWEMHDQLFSLKGALSPGNIEEAAKRAGLDIERWKEDMESAEVMERITKDREEAKKLGLKGTPTIFVNGVEFQEPVKYLPQFVEEALFSSQ
ncbi:MAG: thioredoxin domain-containing protein [Pseudomonadota bacterium]